MWLEIIEDLQKETTGAGSLPSSRYAKQFTPEHDIPVVSQLELVVPVTFWRLAGEH